MEFTQEDYIKGLEQQGRKTCIVNNQVWATYTEAGTVTRCPAFLLNPPSREDIQIIFDKLHPFIVTYAIKAVEGTDSNGFLYATSNTNYDIEQLDRNGRRDARRAIRCFDMVFVDWETITTKGYEAYHDTRSRNNLSDATLAAFQKLIATTSAMKCNKSIAAIDVETKEIGGFLILTEVDDWVEITGAFSSNKHLQNCPNNGLFHFSQEYYLKSGRAKTISYGYSSIQTGSSRDGLHAFKERIGFDAIPIRRIFELKPALKMLLNPISKIMVSLLLKLVPRSRQLNKIAGMFELLK